MKPLRIKLIADAVNHYVYNGDMYIALSDGSIRRYSLKTIFHKIEEKYSSIEGIDSMLGISFKRNLYFNTYPVKMILKVPEVVNGLLKAWYRFSHLENLEIDLKSIPGDVIISEIPSPILDMKIYGNTIYIGCVSGLYSIPINKREKCDKKFDGKTYGITTGYCNVFASLGCDGVSHYNPFEEKDIQDKRHLDKHSSQMSWVPSGGLVNYYLSTTPIYIGNRISKFERRDADNYKISQFATSVCTLEDLMEEDLVGRPNQAFLFNSNKNQYLLSKTGQIYIGEYRIREGSASRLTMKSGGRIKKTKKNGNCMSGHAVDENLLIEFEDGVILLQDDKQYHIEDESVVSMHTYPGSSHFKDLISFTLEDCITMHSIDVLSKYKTGLHACAMRNNYDIIPDGELDNSPF